jgi:acetyl-CoA C-acetyltransferase
MTDIVIAAAARTPIGAFNGGLSSLPAHRLGEIAIREALQRAQVDAAEVSEVVFGQVLTAGAGQNPARQAAVAAGIPMERTIRSAVPACAPSLWVSRRSIWATPTSWSPGGRKA